MKAIEEYVSEIEAADREVSQAARLAHGNLTKPPGSLGKLEEVSIRLAGILGTSRPSLESKIVFTMAADHGVTKEGVSAYPSEVTRQMVLNFAAGGAAINVLARHVGVDVRVVDMGVASNESWPDCITDRKIAAGTKNMALGPAMSAEEARRSLEIGAELALRAIDDGASAVAVGDMGIGNTTAASAITAVVTGKTVAEVTGKGTGIDDSRLRLKVSVIEKALRTNVPDPSNGCEILSKVGGFEIGGIAGVVLGAASARVPVFLDGFVSTSGALIAGVICPESVDYMIGSHLSVEPGHTHAMAHLGLSPLLDLGMRLGEGTGAVLAMSIADASCKVLSQMATFESAGVSESGDET